MRARVTARVPPGGVVLWANPTERARFRAGAVLVVLGAATVGGLAGYAIATRRHKRSNPRRRRRR